MSAYRDEARRIIEDAHHEPIRILVWGPGDPGSKGSAQKRQAYEKRVQIRETLRHEFPRGEVYFSEDPEMTQIAAGIRGQLRREALQASLSDLVLMLDVSRGTDLELDHFVPTYSWFREKVYVFLPQRYVPPKGLVREVFDYLRPDQIEGFSPKDFRECTLATEKAVQVAETVALEMRLRR